MNQEGMNSIRSQSRNIENIPQNTIKSIMSRKFQKHSFIILG